MPAAPVRHRSPAGDSALNFPMVDVRMSDDEGIVVTGTNWGQPYALCELVADHARAQEISQAGSAHVVDDLLTTC